MPCFTFHFEYRWRFVDVNATLLEHNYESIQQNVIMEKSRYLSRVCENIGARGLSLIGQFYRRKSYQILLLSRNGSGVTADFSCSEQNAA